jgi:uncharacterized protein
MLKSELKEIIILQNKKSKKEELIQRNSFNYLEEQINNRFIIIITGIRRCGKSTLLLQLKEKYSGYYLNFDDERLSKFKLEDFQKLYDCLLELYGEKEIFYFDEIQNVDGWERFVRRLHNDKKKVFITGSNASMLSKELGTHLTGRHIQVEILPFSFDEFLRFKNIKLDINAVGIEKSELINSFKEYMYSGGFPEYLKTKNVEYLKFLYENILYKDIMVRNKIINEYTIKELTGFIATNISKEISFNSIKKMLNLGSSTTVKDYFFYLENSFLIFLISKHEYSFKKQIYGNKKAYFIDSGMAGYIGFRFTKDIGRILENVVFIELRRRKKKIFFHKEKYECDFVCSDMYSLNLNPNLLIQVCLELDEKNSSREYEGILEAIKKHKLKEGFIITLDQEDELKIDNKRIIIKPIWKWLLE